jgi:ribosomal protein S18 acetylase RimI-like enzyme
VAITVGPATRAQWPAAARVLFPDSADRLVALLRSGEIDPAGLFAVTDEAGRIIAATLAVVSPGAQGQLVPPHAEEAVAVPLLSAATDWLDERGVKVVQVNRPVDDEQNESLLRSGFDRVTTLLHFVRETGGEPSDLPFRLRPYSDFDPARFTSTLLATYEGTLDGPELDGVRTPEEIVAGYRGTGVAAPDWFLAEADGEPAGVLLLGPGDSPREWELTYLGVLPAFRGRRFGTALARVALRLAADRGAAMLAVGVDERNAPAIRLYETVGFQIAARSAVFLRIGKNGNESSNRSSP